MEANIHRFNPAEEKQVLTFQTIEKLTEVLPTLPVGGTTV